MIATTCAYEVRALEDRFWVCSQVRRFAESAGLRRGLQARIVLSAAELASNLAKHAGSGSITIALLGAPRRGVLVRAEDRGPGIASPAQAVSDGFSQGRLLTPDDPGWLRHGLGSGLGAVARAMSEMRIEPRAGGGVTIEAYLWTHEGVWTNDWKGCDDDD